jgi:hypothetical protein
VNDAETVQWIAVTVDTDELSVVTRAEADPVPVLAMVAGRSAAESSGARTPAVITGKTLYLLDIATEPSEHDAFIVRGDRYEVEGEAHRWGDQGVEVAVVRAEQQPAEEPAP